MKLIKRAIIARNYSIAIYYEKVFFKFFLIKDNEPAVPSGIFSVIRFTFDFFVRNRKKALSNSFL